MQFRHQFTVAIAAVGLTLAGAYCAWAAEAGGPLDTPSLVLVKDGGGHGSGHSGRSGGGGHSSMGRSSMGHSSMGHSSMGRQGMAMSHGRRGMHSSGHNFRRGYYDNDGDFTFFPIFGNIYADGDNSCYWTCRQSHGPRFCRRYGESYCN